MSPDTNLKKGQVCSASSTLLQMVREISPSINGTSDKEGAGVGNADKHPDGTDAKQSYNFSHEFKSVPYKPRLRSPVDKAPRSTLEDCSTDSKTASLEAAKTKLTSAGASGQIQLIDLVDEISILTSDSASDTAQQPKTLRAQTPNSKQTE